MKTEWTEELTAEKPEQFQQLSPETWIQRKNIQKEPNREDGDGGYRCESRKISKDVYEAIMEERDSLTMTAILEGQQITDEVAAEMMLNQMDILANQEAQDATMAELLLSTL